MVRTSGGKSESDCTIRWRAEVDVSLRVSAVSRRWCAAATRATDLPPPRHRTRRHKMPRRQLTKFPSYPRRALEGTATALQRACTPLPVPHRASLPRNLSPRSCRFSLACCPPRFASVCHPPSTSADCGTGGARQGAAPRSRRRHRYFKLTRYVQTRRECNLTTWTNTGHPDCGKFVSTATSRDTDFCSVRGRETGRIQSPRHTYFEPAVYFRPQQARDGLLLSDMCQIWISG
jgi:hypothetical protein